MAGKEPIGELDGTRTALRVLIIFHTEGGKVVKRGGEIERLMKARG